MHTIIEREKAIKLFLKFKSYSRTVNKLGYPSTRTLRRWIEEYNKNGFLHKKFKKENNCFYKSRYTDDQINIAVSHYLEYGECISFTVRELGYPSKGILKNWLVDKNIKTNKIFCNSDFVDKALSDKQKNKNNVTSIKNLNYDIINNKEKKEVNYMKNDVHKNKSKIRDKTKYEDKNSAKNYEDLLEELEKVRLERDVYKMAAELIKKDIGINKENLTNPERTIIINALNNKYSIKSLLKILNISKSVYYYNKRQLLNNKYDYLKPTITNIFNDSFKTYGYRRIHIILKKEFSITISEKIVRKIMKEEKLIVITIKRKKYNSYKGELSPEVPNEINRDFHAKNINEKWLTDITEFSIPSGKIYLSPLVDCFDGGLVSWSIGTSPNAELVNTMLESGILKLNNGEKPIIHSDRGCHYRWPIWIDIMDKNKLKRSMSKKGCSPDNSACEGFFGRIKNEMFYNKKWKGVSTIEFINILNTYLIWYNEKRIKISLGGCSPMEYRHKLGL
ncbi:MAG: IS3 family transposase [Clostridia bacterium]